ncbi:MAG: MFS transporter [Nitratireductor sp.]|nr:MFS transporter [Nitratireductor sp.]
MRILSFLQENLRWIAGGFLLCLFSSFGQTFFIALSGGQIRAEYGLSNGEWGSLYMAATLASAVTLTQLGRIVDHVSIAVVAAIIIPALGLACFLMGVSQSVVLLGLAVYLLRLFGQGMMTHTSMTAMGRWYSGNRGTAVSLAALGHQTGEALLPLAMVSLFAVMGWREAWYLAAAILVVLALPLVFSLLRVERMPKTTDRAEVRRASRDWTRREVMADPLFWTLLLGVLAPAFIGTTIFFHQAYLVELRGWPLETFAASFTVMALMTILFALVCGQLIDRFGAIRILPFFLLPLGLSCFLLATVPSSSAIVIFMGLMGISYGFSTTLFGALWPELYGTAHLGAVRSVAISLMVFSSAAGPGITGLLIDAGVSYLAQIFAMGIWCLAASAIMLFVARRLASRAAGPIEPETAGTA